VLSSKALAICVPVKLTQRLYASDTRNSFLKQNSPSPDLAVNRNSLAAESDRFSC
jgi:hypothetical protein